ncbi:hypothetical protein HY468_03725 [Candidatus Roizmanbacteria bacterium]|nr:hypothetical protein [Candidatus Roizmanbacteria bacterium]
MRPDNRFIPWIKGENPKDILNRRQFFDEIEDALTRQIDLTTPSVFYGVKPYVESEDTGATQFQQLRVRKRQFEPPLVLPDRQFIAMIGSGREKPQDRDIVHWLKEQVSPFPTKIEKVVAASTFSEQIGNLELFQQCSQQFFAIFKQWFDDAVAAEPDIHPFIRGVGKWEISLSNQAGTYFTYPYNSANPWYVGTNYMRIGLNGENLTAVPNENYHSLCNFTSDTSVGNYSSLGVYDAIVAEEILSNATTMSFSDDPASGIPDTERNKFSDMVANEGDDSLPLGNPDYLLFMKLASYFDLSSLYLPYQMTTETDALIGTNRLIANGIEPYEIPIITSKIRSGKLHNEQVPENSTMGRFNRMLWDMQQEGLLPQGEFPEFTEQGLYMQFPIVHKQMEYVPGYGQIRVAALPTFFTDGQYFYGSTNIGETKRAFVVIGDEEVDVPMYQFVDGVDGTIPVVGFPKYFEINGYQVPSNSIEIHIQTSTRHPFQPDEYPEYSHDHIVQFG